MQIHDIYPENVCPGKYCGRTLSENGSLSTCGPCLRGFRVNTSAICTLCEEPLTIYEWLYLAFMVLLSLILHCFFIDIASKHRSFSKDGLILHSCAFLEILLSCICTILVVNPIGSLDVLGCKINGPSDWYTYLHNPVINYEMEINCTQEAVYPLFTAVFILYGFNLAFMLLIRPLICARYLPRNSKMSIYSALYFLPILTLIHAVTAGFLYYTFPYIIIMLSLVSNTAHFAIRLDQSATALVVETLKNSRNIVILLVHWLLHAYGILSFISMNVITLPGIDSLYLFVLVPLPTFFYIATSQLTDPAKFDKL